MNYNDEIPELDAAGLRKFFLEFGGLLIGVFGLAFPLLIHGWKALAPPYASGQILAVAIGVLLIVWALVAPGGLGWLHRGLMRVTSAIGSVVSRVVMGIVFYAVVLPIGFIMRSTGHDPMRRKFEPESESYRVVRTKQINPADMEKPF